EGEHVSPAALDEDGRVVTVFSASKTYAMTGWRVGYLVAPPPLADLIAKVQEPVVSCATAVAQKALEAALLGPQDCVREMRDAYRRRRDATVRALRAEGLFVTEPRGAFYLFAEAAAAGDETFGPRASGLVRLSLAASEDALAEGVGRLARGLEAWTRSVI